jgi:hypothetical protein
LGIDKISSINEVWTLRADLSNVVVFFFDIRFGFHPFQ